jgi:hypothetical protein
MKKDEAKGQSGQQDKNNNTNTNNNNTKAFDGEIGVMSGAAAAPKLVANNIRGQGSGLEGAKGNGRL